MLREDLERQEAELLSPYASLSARSKGRARPVESCVLRTAFQRDRDRIVHCNSFRRLKHKMQMFLSPMGDHYRTRLTHTMEVSQIARTIARALRLNEDLTEAIALGHDLGHTPFGHTGERTLSRLMSEGFEHNVQSLRVVEFLERDGQGLNLTFEVRDGILNHPSDCTPATLEGEVVSIADKIAYLNHDIDDAMRAGLLSPEDLPRESLDTLGATHGARIEAMILDIVENSLDQPQVRMSESMYAAMMALRQYMFDYVYGAVVDEREERRASRMLEHLFEYYVGHSEELPPEYGRTLAGDGCERAVCDYIAGMTDRYAIRLFESLFIPTPLR